MPAITRKPKGTTSREEQETTITIDPTTKKASIFSTVPAMIRKLYDFAEQSEEVEINLDNEFCLGILVPMNWIRVRPPIKRELSEEQKAAAAERLSALRQKNKSCSSP